MGEKKYLVCPGYVISKNDGERHFIDANTLMRLYGVNPSLCILESPIHNMQFHGPLIRLEPRYDGNYALEARPNAKG